MLSLLTQHANFKQIYFVCVYAGNAAILCLYPLAGFLADNKIGRFKTVYHSSIFLLVLIILEGIIYAILLILSNYISTEDSSIAFGALLLSMTLLVTVTFPLFNANIIQFGVDQLQDSPADHRVCLSTGMCW